MKCSAGERSEPNGETMSTKYVTAAVVRLSYGINNGRLPPPRSRPSFCFPSPTPNPAADPLPRTTAKAGNENIRRRVGAQQTRRREIGFLAVESSGVRHMQTGRYAEADDARPR